MASDPNETVEGALTKFYVRRFFNLDYLIGEIDKKLIFLLS